VDCDDLARRYFDGQLPTPYIEGFVVIRSPESLDVTGVYSTATVSDDGLAGDHSSIHVEQIRERVLQEQPPTGKPDLVIKDIGAPEVSCPGGGGTCVTKVGVTVANIGTADAGAFNTRVMLDPGQSVIVDHAITGLGAGDSQTFPVATPPSGNCFDPDCTICVTADNQGQVDESDEGNNQLCETTPG
jgi:hypothetical protein